MIGGIQIFLPLSPVEARVCVADAATGERQPVVTVREMEQTSEAAQAEEDEHSKEWLNIFSQEAEKTATLELAVEKEEEADNMSFVDLCEQIETLERRVIVQRMHIQQVKLETDGGAYQPKEQLGEVGLEPTQREMAAANCHREKLSSSSVMRLQNWNFPAEWQVKATRDGKNGMGDHDDLPICREEV
jgi:hypothetical protein